MGGILVELFSDFIFGVTHTAKMVVFGAVITLLALNRTFAIVVWPCLVNINILYQTGKFVLRKGFLPCTL